MKYRISLICVMLLIFSVLTPFQASGADAPDIGKKCSLTLLLASDTDQNNTVAGAEITYYQLAEASLEQNTPVYSYTDDFADCGEDISAIADRANKLSEYAVSKGISGKTIVTGKDGMVTAEGLSAGVYLVTETATVGTFTVFDPFVVFLPEYDEGKWVYDAFAAPKITADAIGTDVSAGSLVSVSVKKVWNVSDEVHPDSVKINLIGDSGIYDTVTLNTENNWQHTWKGVSSKTDWRVEEADIPAGYTASYSQDGYVFTVTNSTKLIQTGQLNWPVPVLFFAGLLCVSAGIMVNICRRRVSDEK